MSPLGACPPLYGRLWKQQAGALDFLKRLWNDPEIQDDVARFIEIGKRLKSLPPGAERSRLVKEEEILWSRKPRAALLKRMVE